VDPALLLPRITAAGIMREVAVLFVRCVAARAAERPKAAELYQALRSVWGGIDE
jgi:hypothetical protein